MSGLHQSLFFLLPLPGPPKAAGPGPGPPKAAGPSLPADPEAPGPGPGPDPREAAGPGPSAESEAHHPEQRLPAAEERGPTGGPADQHLSPGGSGTSLVLVSVWFWSVSVRDHLEQ